jgi:hypothetical protein
MIEIKKTSIGGGGALTYPILQETIDLSNSDFTKLLTSPIQILPNQSNYICPLNITIQYTNTNVGFTTSISIGFESILPTGNYLCFFATPSIALVSGTFTFSIPNGAGGTPSTTTDFEPLILWSNTDDLFLTFSKFIVTITYLRIPNL